MHVLILLPHQTWTRWPPRSTPPVADESEKGHSGPAWTENKGSKHDEVCVFMCTIRRKVRGYDMCRMWCLSFPTRFFPFPSSSLFMTINIFFLLFLRRRTFNSFITYICCTSYVFESGITPSRQPPAAAAAAAFPASIALECSALQSELARRLHL